MGAGRRTDQFNSLAVLRSLVFWSGNLMRKIIFYFLTVVLGACGALSTLRGLELLLTGTITAYGAGRLAGSFIMGPILLFAAWKVFTYARNAPRPNSENDR